MTWNTDITQAPRGETREVELTHKGSGNSFTRTIKQKSPVLLSVSGSVIVSTWNDARGQWSGVANDQTPDAWQPWPDPYVTQEEHHK